MRFVLGLFFCLLLGLSVFAKGDDKPMAQNFTGTTLDGKAVSLEDLRGKIVVLTFWSTRCQICAAEIPKLNQLVDKYAGKDVVFLGLTMENETKVAEHLQKKPFKFTIVPNSLGVIMQYSDRDSAGRYNISYPSMFVINQKGEIELKTSGWNKTKSLDSQIGNLLAAK